MPEFRKKRKKICHMCAGKPVDYKDVNIIITTSNPIII